MTDWADEIAQDLLNDVVGIVDHRGETYGNHLPIAAALRKARADGEQAKGVLIYEQIVQGRQIPSWAYRGEKQIHGLCRVSIFLVQDSIDEREKKIHAPQLKNDTILDVFTHPNPIWEHFFSGPELLKRLDYPAFYASQVPK
jgi:hypothetical protein